MAGVAGLLTTTGRLPTGQILFHDAATPHISQLLHLREDLHTLPLKCFQAISHSLPPKV
jgi:hypothetical protein